MYNNESLTQLSNLITDACTNKIGMFEDQSVARFSDQAVREAFFKIIGSDRLTWQSFRNHKNEIYTVMETVLNTNLPLAWENSPFYDQFVEYKNGALGDKNAFVVEDKSVLVCTKFSGNHWNTERQKLQGVREVAVPTEWIYIRVYDELERFLTGNQTLVKMMQKLQEGFNRSIDDRIATSFIGASTYLPTAFKEGGVYDRETMTDLIEKVQIASQSDVVIAGTRVALGKIMPEETILSDNAKEELATTGLVMNNNALGVQGILIPQTFVKGTYTTKNPNNVIYIMPKNFKPIKVFFEGDTRARERSVQDNEDMTIDTQVQTKIGTAVVFQSLFGTYTIS